MFRYRRQGRHGFTLVELLIVIAIIALLALLVVPRLMGAVRKAKESTLRESLHTIRTALSQFFADTGTFPGKLEDLAVAKEADISVSVPKDSYKGPYLTSPGGVGGTGVPRNPFSIQSSTDMADHWEYDATLGTVGVPASQKTDIWLTLDDHILFRDL